MMAAAASVEYGVGHLYSFATFNAPFDIDTFGYYTFYMPYNGPVRQRASNPQRSLVLRSHPADLVGSTRSGSTPRP